MGLKEAMDYAQELKKAERAKDLRDRASSSRPGSRRSSSRASNLSRNGSAVRIEGYRYLLTMLLTPSYSIENQ